MSSTITASPPPPVITCPSWCEEPHLDDWTNDEDGLPTRAHGHEFGSVSVYTDEHLTDAGQFTTDDPAILANVGDALTIEQAEQLVQDLQAAIGMARAILAGTR